MRILLIDIETSPSVVYTWGLFNQNISIDKIVSSGRTICFAAKWLGDDDIMYFGHDTNSHRAMIRKAHKLLDQADAIVTYNGNSFDLPTLNKEFALLGLTPPSPYRKIDLLNTVRNRFRFTSNKLDYVSQALKLGKKLPHKGFELWTGCMNGDEDSWKTMQEYNKQDVVLLESLYNELLPWIAQHPNRNIQGEEIKCPVCGSTHYQKRGTTSLTAGVYQQYRCNPCGHWFRGTTNLAAKGKNKTRSLPL